MWLLAPGDSWANGAELDHNEEPFGSLLSKKLGRRYLHTAQDGSSIPHLILQSQQNLNKIPDTEKDIICVFLLTSPDRDLCWSQHRAINTGALFADPPPYETPREIFLNAQDPVHRDWFTGFYTEELATYRTNTTLLALQSLCRYHGIIDYYAWAWDTVTLWPEIDTDRFFAQGLKDIREHIGYRPGHHPNFAQHQKICDLFSEMISTQNN